MMMMGSSLNELFDRFEMHGGPKKYTQTKDILGVLVTYSQSGE